MPYFSATFSAVCPIESVPYRSFILGLTNRHPRLVSKISTSRAQGLLDFESAYGARVMLSTPQATKRSPSPSRAARAADATALIPDAHRRFTVSPGTDAG